MTPSVVKGDSMLPNLRDGDRIIISKLHTIERFDEIAFMAPDTNDNYVKRVVGMPGDRVQIIDEVLYINDVPYQEAYLDDLRAELMGSGWFTIDFDLEQEQGFQVVPEGSYFVLGDNRPISRDSRDFGMVDKEAVIGEVVFRIWPLEGAGVVGPEL